MEKKYELTNETITVCGRTLHRIRALKSFSNIRKLELGGFIEKEENLSQFNNSWVGGNACVLENACVCDNASVSGYACVYGNAMMSDYSRAFGEANIYGDSHVCGYATIRDMATVRDAFVSGHSNVRCCANICENAYVLSTKDFIAIGKIGSRSDYTTFYKNRDNGISVQCGCFNGKVEEFEEAVKETHGGTFYEKQYMAAVELAKLSILRNNKESEK